MPSLAELIPPELFSRILVHCNAQDGPMRQLYPKEMARPQRELASRCGQVCRYWAEQCRPSLFSLITLRCADDARAFRTVIARSTTSSISIPPVHLLIRQVLVEVKAGDVSGNEWPLLLSTDVTQKLVNLIKSRDKLPLSINGGSSTHLLFHRGFARTLPPSTSPYTSLLLYHIHLRSDTELCRLLQAIPALEHVDLRRVTLELSPDPQTFSHTKCLGPNVSKLHVNQSGVKLEWFIPAFVARVRVSASSQRRKYSLDADDCHTLTQANILSAVFGKGFLSHPAQLSPINTNEGEHSIVDCV